MPIEVARPQPQIQNINKWQAATLTPPTFKLPSTKELYKKLQETQSAVQDSQTPHTVRLLNNTTPSITVHMGI